VILDAKYDRQSLRAAVIDLARSQSIPLQIVHCMAPEEVLRDRFAHRTGDIADATPIRFLLVSGCWSSE
jgi:uncharacterized protein